MPRVMLKTGFIAPDGREEELVLTAGATALDLQEPMQAGEQRLVRIPVLREATVLMTFREIQQELDQLSLQERVKLWQTCPAPHPAESLLALNTSLKPGVLRYAHDVLSCSPKTVERSTRPADATNVDTRWATNVSLRRQTVRRRRGQPTPS